MYNSYRLLSLVLLFLALFYLPTNPLYAQCTPGCITPGASTNLRLRFNTENLTDLMIGAYGGGLNYNVYWYQESNPLICGFQCGITTANFTITGLSLNTFYIVEVSGYIPSMSFYYYQNVGYSTTRHTQLRQVQQWGNIAFQNLTSAFQQNTLLDVTATDAPNLTGFPVVNLELMFYYCSNLVGNASFNTWNTANVYDMGGMFGYTNYFNQPLNNWNVSNVTNMAYMFYNATNFNQPLNNWNTSNVINMAYMFNSASNFNQNIGSWNVSNVVYMTGMFAGSNFNNGGSPSINSWNVGNVQSMRGMFGYTGCCGSGSPFNQPIGNWNVSNVTDMYGMFYNATLFNQDIGTWNVGNVVNMAYMFTNAAQFNNGSNTNPINGWNTASVTNMSYMFYRASQFNRNIGSWNVGAVTTMQGMFQAATLFNNGGSPSINNWNVSNVTNMRGMFGYTGGGPTGCAFNQPIGNWDVSNVTDMYGMFYNAYLFDQDIGTWNVSNVTNMSYMFGYTGQFNNGSNANPINNWNVSNVTNMYCMFYYANAFNRPIGSWNTANVLDMRYMFYGSSSFNQNIGTWALHPTVLMDFMLSYANGITCTTYEQILQGWATYAGSNGIVFRNLGAHSRMYSTAGVPARNALLGLGWTITGDGLSLLTPAFAALAPNNGSINICQTNSLYTLPVNADQGYGGTWSPSNVIDLSNPANSGVYTFNPGIPCVNSYSVTINIVNPGVTITQTPAGPICQGSPVSLQVNNGSSGSTYTWSDAGLSGATPSINPILNTTTYTVTVTNPVGCSGAVTASHTVNVVTPSLSGVSIAPNPSATICQGSSVSLQVLGGSGISNFTWNPNTLSGDNPTISPTLSGSYTVTVTNPASCAGTVSATTFINVVSPSSGLVSVTASPSGNICIGSPVTLNVSGGTGSSTYAWSNGGLSGSNPSFTPGATDTYTVTVTNPAGCSGALTASVTVNVVTPSVSVSPNPSGTVCQGTPVALQVNGNSGLSTYTWSDVSLSGNSPTFTPTSSGTYTVTVTNPLGCSGTAAANVNVNVVTSPGVAISPSPSSTVCVGSAATLNVVGGNAGSGYAWSDPLLTGSSPLAAITTAGANTYTVTVTNPTACSGTATASVVITGVNPSVSIGASPSTSICAGSVVNLNVSGGGVGSTYSWSDGSLSGSTPSFTLNSSNVYTVTVTNPAGCSGTAMANVSLTAVNALGAGVGITASPSSNICAGNPVTLTVSGGGSGSSYSWSNGSLSGATPTFTPGATDTYTVTISNPSACSGTLTASIPVNVITPTVAINASPSATVCQGSSVSLNVSGGGGSSTYTWSDGSLSGNSPNFVPVSSNTYTVTVSDPMGCSGSATANINIIVNTPPVITSVSTTDISNCGMTDGSITINASGNGVLQYSIDGGNAYVNNGGIFSNLAPGSYQVAVVDAAGCEVVGNIYTVNGVSLPPPPQAQNQYIICNGQTMGNLTAQPTYNGVITWYSDAGLSNAIGTGSSFNVNSYLQPGSNYFYATENVNGCEGASVTIEVVVNPGITATITQSDSLICPNSYVTLVVSLNQQQPQTQYAWNTGATGATLQVNTAGTYTVTVNQLGCVTTASIQVNAFNPVLGMPHANNDFGSTWINQNIQIPILSNDSSNNSVVNIITPPSNGVLSYNNGVLLYSPSIGFYGVDSVQYTLCSNVCSMICDTAWVIIDVNRISEFNIPGAITPNNDGKNDVWVIEGLEDYPDNEVKILNAWGDIVYTAAPYINNWSGECNNSLKLVGDRLPRGTYYYVIDLKDGVTPPIKGFVELSY